MTGNSVIERESERVTRSTGPQDGTRTWAAAARTQPLHGTLLYQENIFNMIFNLTHL